MGRKTAQERSGGHMDAGTLVIDAHINEPVVRLDAADDELAPWRALADRHPGWQQAGHSGGRTVSLILQHPDNAVAEVGRAAGLGAVAVMIPPVVGSRNLDDPSLQPFFDAPRPSASQLGSTARRG
jgi:hypothetical protein